jgi:nucleoside-diphosphate-sugar epimerase
MDSARLHAMGWNNARDIEAGIQDAYAHFLETREIAR